MSMRGNRRIVQKKTDGVTKAPQSFAKSFLTFAASANPITDLAIIPSNTVTVPAEVVQPAKSEEKTADVIDLTTEADAVTAPEAPANQTLAADAPGADLSGLLGNPGGAPGGPGGDMDFMSFLNQLMGSKMQPQTTLNEGLIGPLSELALRRMEVEKMGEMFKLLGYDAEEEEGAKLTTLLQLEQEKKEVQTKLIALVNEKPEGSEGEEVDEGKRADKELQKLSLCKEMNRLQQKMIDVDLGAMPAPNASLEEKVNTLINLRGRREMADQKHALVKDIGQLNKIIRQYTPEVVKQGVELFGLQEFLVVPEVTSGEPKPNVDETLNEIGSEEVDSSVSESNGISNSANPEGKTADDGTAPDLAD